ncbi:uncharacterized protein LOC106150593 isoform X1 [Lingula anatina]|uniref:Uncharacterized protein LOC106150593 isoform X1 n=1 Tax=Lingula anatina TaxID=7574 RepID=A0A1S3GYU4_LINAN|nr:uncharacterized protein LOC106150593 isoform X1 [Lingula anatina]|eukprot:XP_013378933.1 uncharacterized protein LOC106150593 isoform X1 [Lingula anatina]
MISFFQRLKRSVGEMTVGEGQGPVRKRPRLSLKLKNKSEQKTEEVDQQKCESPQTGDGAPSKVQEEEESELPPLETEATERRELEVKEVPKVAGLENLGNTCFLNSVLQVLRYTPGFSQQLSILYKELSVIERKLAAEAKTGEGDSSSGDLLPWKLVRTLHKLFNRMDRLEEKCVNPGTELLFTRPERLLDIVRDLNPMFEGNLQHDAHEVLRCMLAYIEDATTEVNKYKVKAVPSIEPVPDSKQPTLMKFFQKNSVKKNLISVDELGSKGHDLAGSRSDQKPANGTQESSPVRKVEELKVPHTPKHSSPSIKIYTAEDIIEHVSGGKNLTSKFTSVNNEVTPVKQTEEEDGTKVTGVDTKTSPSPRSRKRLCLEDAVEEITGVRPSQDWNGHDMKQEKGGGPLLNCSGNGDANINGNDDSMGPGSQRPVLKKDGAGAIVGRKRGRPRKGKSDSCLDHDAEKNVPLKGQSKKKKHSKSVSQEVLSKSFSGENGLGFEEPLPKPLKSNSDSKQPSITAMFAKKRLGMRGAVIKREPSPLAGGGEPNNSSLTPTKQNGRSHHFQENIDIVEDRKLNSAAFVRLTATPDPLSSKNTCQAGIKIDPKQKAKDNKLLSGAYVKIERSPFLESPKKNTQQKAGDTSSSSWNCSDRDSEMISQYAKSHVQDAKLSPGSPQVKLNRHAIDNYCSPKKENKNLSTVCESGTGTKQDSVNKIKIDLFGALNGKSGNDSNHLSNISEVDQKGVETKDAQKTKSNMTIKQSFEKMGVSISSKNQSGNLSLSSKHGDKSNKTSELPSESGRRMDVDLEIVKVVNGDRVGNKDDTDPEDKMDAHQPDTYMASPAKSPKSHRRKTNELDCLVQDLFQGSMALRTRCLECEGFTQRKEDFQDIGVPVKKEKVKKEEGDTDDETDDESCKPGSVSWLMEAFSEIERLQDDNKYFCDQCHRYVEAERSTQYVRLPQILMLHLKRFEANSGLFGGISKVNDFVATPLVLPCFSNRCKQPCRKHSHEFELYAVVMHSGISISSGHYTAYVKAPPVHKMKDPSKKTDVKSAERQRPVSERIKRKGEETAGKANSCNIYTQNEVDIPDYSGNWFECDDERICLKSEEDMQSLLNKQVSICETPYLLFYKMTPVPYERVVLV